MSLTEKEGETNREEKGGREEGETNREEEGGRDQQRGERRERLTEGGRV